MRLTSTFFGCSASAPRPAAVAIQRLVHRVCSDHVVMPKPLRFTNLPGSHSGTLTWRSPSFCVLSFRRSIVLTVRRAREARIADLEIRACRPPSSRSRSGPSSAVTLASPRTQLDRGSCARSLMDPTRDLHVVPVAGVDGSNATSVCDSQLVIAGDAAAERGDNPRWSPSVTSRRSCPVAASAVRKTARLRRRRGAVMRTLPRALCGRREP